MDVFIFGEIDLETPPERERPAPQGAFIEDAKNAFSAFMDMVHFKEVGAGCEKILSKVVLSSKVLIPVSTVQRS